MYFILSYLSTDKELKTHFIYTNEDTPNSLHTFFRMIQDDILSLFHRSF